MKQATPNPFVGNCKLGIEPVDFSALSIAGEAESAWLAKAAEEDRKTFAADKETMAQNFVKEVVAENTVHVVQMKAPFTIKPKLTWWDPGFYVAAASKSSDASLTAQFVDGKGVVLDEVALTTSVSASIMTPTAGGRMHIAGKQLARQLSSYLHARLLCQ